MSKVSRRGFIQLLATAAGAAAVAGIDDPEKLLWEPGKKTIFIPELVTPKNVAPEVPKLLVTDAAQVDEIFNRLKTKDLGLKKVNQPYKFSQHSGDWEIIGNRHNPASDHAPLRFDADWNYKGNPADLADANEKLKRMFPEVNWNDRTVTLGGGKPLTREEWLKRRRA